MMKDCEVVAWATLDGILEILDVSAPETLIRIWIMT